MNRLVAAILLLTALFTIGCDSKSPRNIMEGADPAEIAKYQAMAEANDKERAAAYESQQGN